MTTSRRGRAAGGEAPPGTSEVTTADVLELLGPLQGQYIARAGPAPTPAPTPAVASVSAGGRGPVAAGPRTSPCQLEAIVTVDGRGRVAVPRRLLLTPPPRLRICTGALDFEAHATAVSEVDSRGRLQIPYGVLAASGLRNGDRVALLRIPGTDEVFVVGLRRLLVYVDR